MIVAPPDGTASGIPVCRETPPREPWSRHPVHPPRALVFALFVFATTLLSGEWARSLEPTRVERTPSAGTPEKASWLPKSGLADGASEYRRVPRTGASEGNWTLRFLRAEPFRCPSALRCDEWIRLERQGDHARGRQSLGRGEPWANAAVRGRLPELGSRSAGRSAHPAGQIEVWDAIPQAGWPGRMPPDSFLGPMPLGATFPWRGETLRPRRGSTTLGYVVAVSTPTGTGPVKPLASMVR